MPNLTITKKQALAHTREIKRDIGASKRSRIRILRVIAKSVDAREYEIAGYEDLGAWLAYIGIEMSTSHFLRLLHNVRALKDVPMATLEAMPEGNAHVLARLPGPVRTAEIITKATMQKPAAFRATVADVRKKKLGEEASEQWRTYARRLPQGVYDAILAAEGKVARVLELDISEDSEKRATHLIDVLEAIAELINGTDEAVLLTEIEGKE